MTARFQVVSARLWIFQIYHRIDQLYSVQCSGRNVDEYITQLPAGANLALMVQKSARRPPLLITTVSRWRYPPYAESDYCAGGVDSTRPRFSFTTTLETKGNVENGVLKGDLLRDLVPIRR